MPAAADDHRVRLDAAIEVLRGLADSAAPSQDQRKLLQNLANSLCRRSALWPADDALRQADLRDALAASERGLQLRAESEWDRVYLLSVRAECARLLAGNRIDAAVEQAHVAAVAAARRTGHVELLKLASDWLRLLGEAGRWAEAAAAGDAALSMLEALVEAQAHQHYKQVYLRKGAGLAGATAVARVRAGDADAAIPTLERTLAVLWRQRYLGPRRTATQLVAAGEAPLAERYLALIADARSPDATDEALRGTEQQLAALMPTIEQALRAHGAARAARPAPRAPSLHLVASARGSVALLRGARGHARAIDLPDAPADVLYRMAARFRAEVVAESAADDRAHAASSEIVAWLEGAVLRPIEAALVKLLAGRAAGTARTPAVDPGTDDRRALTVVATGPFVGLPLHAARLSDGRPVATLGVSYAPALAALDSRARRPALAAHVLIVADPTRPGRASLAGALQERRALSAIWPGAVELCGVAARRDSVREALAPAQLIHFACHGTSDDRDPLRSAVLLADADYTLRDVLLTPLRRGCVVVLSACQTAVNDPSLPDEAMSLAAGFLAAGAATVVASLWPVPDAPTAALMAAFHEALRAGASPAHALGHAQGAMAAGRLADASAWEDWRSPYYWAGFIALGASRW